MCRNHVAGRWTRGPCSWMKWVVLYVLPNSRSRMLLPCDVPVVWYIQHHRQQNTTTTFWMLLSQLISVATSTITITFIYIQISIQVWILILTYYGMCWTIEREITISLVCLLACGGGVQLCGARRGEHTHTFRSFPSSPTQHIIILII